MTDGIHLLQIGDEQIKLLKRLSNACAVSGDEGEVRKIVLEELKPHADEMKVDSLGNVLVTRRGCGERNLRVMLAAHMDEVGLMITYDSGEGIYRFDTVGSLSAADLPARAVWVGKDHIPGVIGLKPIHLVNEDERKKPVALDELRIDVGPISGKAKAGDRVAFATTFLQQGPRLRGKALDNRLGGATLIELV